MLNGWRRLWLVCTALWVLWVVRQATLIFPAGTMAEMLGLGVLWAVGLPAAVYLAGVVIAWVARGFRAEGTRANPVR